MGLVVSLVLLPPNSRDANFWCYTAGVVDVVLTIALKSKVYG